MTRQEYEKRLRELSEDKLREFHERFGGEERSIEGRVRDFADHPEHERRICYLLDLQTEDEKLTEAALRSANAAEKSASSARWSAIWSGLACLVAIIAVAVAAFGMQVND